jgi:hypothetical protein
MPDPIGIKVEGLNELARTLRRMDAELPKALTRIHKHIAEGLVAPARSRVRSRTGRLAASIKPAGTARSASLKAGGTQAVPYAGPIHFGWSKRGIVGNPFLSDVVEAAEPSLEAIYTSELASFLDSVSR